MEDCKVLVTGCAGFIGSTLAEKLVEQGYEVIGVDCFTPYYSTVVKHYNLRILLKSKRFSFLELDLSETSFDDLVSVVKRATYIVHEAAQPGVQGSWGESFQEYVRHNIIATQRLLEASAKVGKCKRFVYASSSSVYGDVGTPLLREDMRPRPYSPYGVTKLTAEVLCQAYSENFSLPMVILRYFTVYGPRQRPDMAFHKFARALLSGKPIEVYGRGDQMRDFTYVDDVVEATISALEAPEALGKIINVGSGNPIKLVDAIKILADVIGAEPRYCYIEGLKGDVRYTCADVSKAKQLLGWKPTTSLREGLEREVTWIREVMDLGLL